MAGDLIVGVAVGLAVAVVAYAMGAGVSGGVAAYAGGGALWVTRGLLPRRRR
jgi:hypothetical protein